MGIPPRRHSFRQRRGGPESSNAGSGSLLSRDRGKREAVRLPPRLSINPELLENGKEDSYERLRPQARFGAQPP